VDRYSFIASDLHRLLLAGLPAHNPLSFTRQSCETDDLTSVALFDLRSNGGIGGLKRRFQPRRTASSDAKEREQDEEDANCSPMVGHRIPIRVSQRAAPKRRDCATFLAEINWPLQVAESRRCRSRPATQDPKQIDHTVRQCEQITVLAVRANLRAPVPRERRFDRGGGCGGD
jgi:hypothetical protein